MSKHPVISLLVGFALVFLAGAGPALAMDQAAYNAAQSELAGVLYDLEGNLIEQEAIEMNAKDLTPKGESITARYADYEQRIQQHNAYCQGTYPEPEYSRRSAQCNAEESQINDLIRQLDIERDGYAAQVQELQARDTRRQQAAQPILKRLETGVVHLVTTCIDMTLAEQQQFCHLPTAPGPRTAPMVQQMNATLLGEVSKPAQ